MTDQNESSTASRRALFAGAGAIGAATLITACAGEQTPSSTPTSSANTQPTSAPTTGSGAPETLAKKSDIPVGGGKIFGEQGVVVTQPTAGEFKGFSAICTHQQCVLSSISNGNINCGCHQSQFSVKDGSVKKGPATQALPKMPLKVEGDSISLA